MKISKPVVESKYSDPGINERLRIFSTSLKYAPTKVILDIFFLL